MKSKRRERLLHRSREETTAIRTAIFARANGSCEACGRFIDEESGHWDHRFGRGKEPQTVFNGWAICFACDVAVTTSKPSAAWWVRRFLEHLKECGERSKSLDELKEYLAAAVKAGGEASTVGCEGVGR